MGTAVGGAATGLRAGTAADLTGRSPPVMDANLRVGALVWSRALARILAWLGEWSYSSPWHQLLPLALPRAGQRPTTVQQAHGEEGPPRLSVASSC